MTTKYSNNFIMDVSQQSLTSSRAIMSLSNSLEKYKTCSKLSFEVSYKKPAFLWNALRNILFGKHTSYYTLLLLCYLFSVSIGLTDGKPQIIYSNASSTSELEALSSQSSLSLIGTVRMHRKQVTQETDQRGSGDGNEEDVEFAIRRTTLFPVQLVQNSMLSANNQSSAVKENAAPVIASSFRNIDSQTTNSQEEGESVPPEEPSPKKKPKKCQRNALKRCIDGLPPMNDTGLPTSPEAVNRACRIYDSGITCFDSWAKNCLPNDQRQKVKASITGAHEMYSFLCKDIKFRTDYLKHAHCYKQLSPYWDDCSRQFIDGLRRNSRNNFTAFCCIRLEFVSCVSKYSSRLCSLDATKFSMKMAETLIRTRTRAPIPDCMHINPKQCIPIIENGAAHSTNHVPFLLAFALTSVVIPGSGCFTKSL